MIQISLNGTLKTAQQTYVKCYQQRDKTHNHRYALYRQHIATMPCDMQVTISHWMFMFKGCSQASWAVINHHSTLYHLVHVQTCQINIQSHTLLPSEKHSKEHSCSRMSLWQLINVSDKSALTVAVFSISLFTHTLICQPTKNSWQIGKNTVLLSCVNCRFSRQKHFPGLESLSCKFKDFLGSYQSCIKTEILVTILMAAVTSKDRQTETTAIPSLHSIGRGN